MKGGKNKKRGSRQNKNYTMEAGCAPASQGITPIFINVSQHNPPTTRISPGVLIFIFVKTPPLFKKTY